MQWLTPFIGLYAAAVAVPLLLLLYFLKLKRHEMLVSSTLLWKRAVQDLQVNAPFQRLRRRDPARRGQKAGEGLHRIDAKWIGGRAAR